VQLRRGALVAVVGHRRRTVAGNNLLIPLIMLSAASITLRGRSPSLGRRTGARRRGHRCPSGARLRVPALVREDSRQS
jgi:hypothetical protein